MPKNPSAEFWIIAGRMAVLSETAEGEKRVNTPILQIIMKMTYGIILNSIEGTLKKYF